ncbi:protein mono-ADP-ribosyltransferase PARP15-like isoform X6 [Haliotis rufescens]|uniref:protein mono-ADP-ribosyltransferase PARP15-like isoform X6 n=1 Tax=Haliotis rufescens TaxID=6454 RepID=UPI00201F9FB6|nr:protein mono-ADP-ribosyltransferase PARP15-like isoform X6 [Haliotis rufescens]
MWVCKSCNTFCDNALDQCSSCGSHKEANVPKKKLLTTSLFKAGGPPAPASQQVPGYSNIPPAAPASQQVPGYSNIPPAVPFALPGLAAVGKAQVPFALPGLAAVGKAQVPFAPPGLAAVGKAQVPFAPPGLAAVGKAQVPFAPPGLAAVGKAQVPFALPGLAAVGKAQVPFAPPGLAAVGKALVPFALSGLAAVGKAQVSGLPIVPQPICIVTGEIAKEHADVLVNTTGTNVNLLAGTVSYTFLEAGGKGLQEELTRACPSGLKVGGIAETTGGKLQCQKVFHVVLKQWMNKNDAAETILERVVYKCLQMASNQGFTSIAFPALGSGFHRFPGNRSADIIITAVEAFLQTNSTLRTVKLVVHPSNELMRKEFEARRQGLSVTFDNSKLTEIVFNSRAAHNKRLAVWVIAGLLVKSKADVLVNTTQTDLELSVGAVSGSLLEAGGQVLQDECRQQYPSGVKAGTLVQTQGGKLACKKVFHVVLEVWAQENKKALTDFAAIVTNCLHEARKQGFKSISFPLLGTGFAEYPPEISTTVMMAAFKNFIDNHPNTSLETVSVVIHPKDESIRKVVEAHVSKIEEPEGGASMRGTNDPYGLGQKHPFSETPYVTGEKAALEGTTVKYFELTNNPILRNTPEYSHYSVVESQFFSFLSKDSVNRHTFKLTKVEYVVNPALVKQFRAAQRRMANKQTGFENPLLGFHGTAEDNIKSICREGFRQPDHPYFEEVTDVGWYGNGIYFSKYPRFSMNYMQKTCKLLLCKVLQGKIFKCENLKLGAPKEPGYDSHVDPFGKEIVIYEDDCILPCYIVHFDILGRFKFPDDGASLQDDDHTLSQYLNEMDMHKGEELPGF